MLVTLYGCKCSHCTTVQACHHCLLCFCHCLVNLSVVSILLALCMQRPTTAAGSSEEAGQGEVAASEVREVQAAVDLVQKQMRAFDGSFLQFRCDEKGFLSICAFGLPGKTHEDSPARAIQVCCLPSATNSRSGA